MLLYVCPDCHGWHMFASFGEMVRLSGGLGIVLCVNGCGIMLPIRKEDKLKVVHSPVKGESYEMPVHQ